VRLAGKRTVPAGRLTAPILANIALVAAAIAVGLVAEQLRTNTPVPFWRGVAHHVLSDYFANTRAFVSLHVGMIWIEGLTLALFAERIAAAEPAAARRVVHLLLAGAAGAAVFTVNRIAEVFLRNDASMSATAAALSRARIGVHWADINAVASFYALAVVPALFLAWRVRRLWLCGAAMVLFIGLWFAASRMATVAAAAGLLGVALLSRRMSMREIVVGIAAAAAVVTLAFVWSFDRTSSAMSSFRFRAEMAEVAIDLTRQHPGFGIGLGQFQRESIPWISPELNDVLSAGGAGENAHNNYLQILAEQGVAGAAGFAWLLLAPAGAFVRSVRSGQAPPHLVGLVGGLAAFLATCLTGHPLLTPQMVWLFFLPLGLAGGLAASAVPASPSSRQRYASIAFVVFVACSVPFRIVSLK
jgi:hypothetical protein